MRLFTYCIPVDDGAAPNPFGAVCTLAICKPVIRRVAQKGDWIAGIGSVNVSGKSYKNKLVYAMKVTDKMTMQEYDTYCLNNLPDKIPDITSNNYHKNVGDCIYDYSLTLEPTLRPSVHNEFSRDRDLGGENVLLSNHFYYFGNQALDIPESLHPIIKQGQGHKSNANEFYKLYFVDWIEKIEYTPNKLYGEPQIKLDFSKFYNNKKYNCKSLC